MSAPIRPVGIPRPTGTGAVQAQATTSTTAGGNARGANAVDWQTTRSSAAQVASGVNASLVGGVNNTASGQQSIVGGGFSTASNTYSVALGGAVNVSGANSAGFGLQSADRGSTGRLVFASGQFAAQGDAQGGEHVLRKQTTDATISRLTADAGAAGAANTINLPNFGIFAGRLIVVAKQAGAVNAAVWRIDLAAARGNGAGTVVLIEGASAAVAPTASTGTVTGWVLTVAADTTNGGIAVSGTGAAATTINWVARFLDVEAVTAS